MLDGGTRIREVIPEGQLTTSGEVQFVHSDVIRYSVEIEAFPVDGEVKAFSYIDSDSSDSDGGGAEGRSEERRVGQECRGRWGTLDCKKKENTKERKGVIKK